MECYLRVDIFLAKKQVDEDIDTGRVSDKTKILVQEIAISVISVYVPRCGLDHNQKIMREGNFSLHRRIQWEVGSSAEDLEDLDGSSG